MKGGAATEGATIIEKLYKRQAWFSKKSSGLPLLVDLFILTAAAWFTRNAPGGRVERCQR